MGVSIKPSLPKGMRDFLPQQVAKRRYIINTIQSVFEKYGFQPIETPVMENLETLTGKYGEEGDKLLFKVLNSGDFLGSTIHNLIKEAHNWLPRYLNKVFYDSLNNYESLILNQTLFNKILIDNNHLLKFQYFNSKKYNNILSDSINDFISSCETDIYNIYKLLKTNYERYNLNNLVENELLQNSTYMDLRQNFTRSIVYQFWLNMSSSDFSKEISEKGLRYDLTVPLARYVVQNQNDIVFPFKRYHIAPVWRADRPQKGRYREFYQCDADVIGSNSLVNEVELTKIYAEVFSRLDINVGIKLNSRKILTGLLEHLELTHLSTDIITEIDKLDKIGKKKVMENIAALGVYADAVFTIEKVLIQQDKVAIDEIYHLNHTFQTGVNEVGYLQSFNIPALEIDFSLARGLDYYTGCIFEVKAKDYQIGSIGGGGRYDNLTEMFGKKDLTGVGISFGLDRIYDVLDALEKFPASLQSSTKVMFAHFDEVSLNYAFKMAEKVRKAGISAEIYPDLTKLNKQMKYANDKQIAYVCVVGEEEVQTGILTLKNMQTGTQEKLNIESLIKAIS